MVRLDDPLADGEAEPGSLLLGRVERDEDALPGLGWDPGAGVAEVDLDAGVAEAGLPPAGELVAGERGCDAEGPAPGHGLEGVERQVEEDLLQLLGVALHRRELGRHLQDDVDARWDLGGEELEGPLEDVAHVSRRHARLEGAGVVEEGGHDAVQPVHLLDDDLEELPVLPWEATGVEVLGGALDGGERVADLVGQAGRHLAQRREPVPLLHLLVELGVVDDHRAPVGHLDERGDLVGGEGLLDPLVPAGQEPGDAIAGEQRHADPGLHEGHGLAGVDDPLELLGDGGRHGGGGRVPLRGGVLGLQFGEPPVEVLEQHGPASVAGCPEEGARGPGLEEGNGLRPAGGEQPVARPVLRDEPERGVGHPAGLGESVEDRPLQLARVDDVHHPVPEHLELADELVAFREEVHHHPLLDPGANGIEEGEDDEGGDQGVEEEEAGANADPGDEAAVDAREHEPEQRDHRDLAEELVEVEETAPQQCLQEQEHVQREGHEAEPLERVAEPEPGKEVEEGERAHHHRPDEHVGEAGTVRAGGGGRHLPPDHGEDRREGEQDEPGDEQRGQLRPCQRRHRHDEAEERAAEHQVPGAPRRAPLHAEELEEEGQRGGGQERARPDGQPLPDVVPAGRSGEAVEELGRREEEEVEGEEGEEREGARAGRAEQRRPGQRQGDDRCEQRCLVADVHRGES